MSIFDVIIHVLGISGSLIKDIMQINLINCMDKWGLYVYAFMVLLDKHCLAPLEMVICIDGALS